MRPKRFTINLGIAVCLSLIVSSVFCQNNINLRRDSVDEGTVRKMKNNLAGILKHRDVNPVVVSTESLVGFLRSYTNSVIQFHFALNPSSKEMNLYLRLPAGFQPGSTYLDASTFEPVSSDEANERKGALNAALHGNPNKFSKAVLVQVPQLVDLANRCSNNNVEQIEFDFGADRIDGEMQPVLYARVQREAFPETEEGALRKTSTSQFIFANYKENEVKYAGGYVYLKVGVMCPPPSSCQ